MAQAHRRLGAEVTVIEAARALGRSDPDLAAVLVQRLRDQGITIREGTASQRSAGPTGRDRHDRRGAP